MGIIRCERADAVTPLITAALGPLTVNTAIRPTRMDRQDTLRRVPDIVLDLPVRHWFGDGRWQSPRHHTGPFTVGSAFCGPP